MLSAAFILAANSWMQHPVGYKMVGGKPQLDNIVAVFTNPVFLWGYGKVVLASVTTGTLVMLAVSAWQLRKGKDPQIFGHSLRLSLIVLVPAITLTLFVGDMLGVVEGTYQPMKIAAAEAQWTTCQPCSFSLFQIGGGNNDHTPTQIIAGPAPAVAAGHQHLGRQGGRDDPAAEPVLRQVRAGQLRAERVHPVLGHAGNGLPRWAGLGVRAVGSLAAVAQETPDLPLVPVVAATWAVITPFLMNTAGWLLTESGRQPWIVQGIMLTKNGISPSTSFTYLVISVVIFIALYVCLAALFLVFMLRYSRREPDPDPSLAGTAGEPDTRVPSMLY